LYCCVYLQFQKHGEVVNTGACAEEDNKLLFLNTEKKLIAFTQNIPIVMMGDSSYRLNFDQGKKKEIQHHN
jgi:hypothetical protein